MPEVLPGYIKITQAPSEYKTSRSTIMRRRDAARKNNDSAVYRNFILQTRDGDQVHEPSRQQVQQLTQEGKVPEWYVSRAWLAKEFDERVPDQHPTTEATSASSIDTAAELITQQYEERISDLKQQLKDMQEQYQTREDKLLDYAQADKQLFAKANENLTQVLALPGITEATKAQQGSTHQDTTLTVVDATTKPQTLEQKPPPNSKTQAKPSSKKSNTTNKKDPDKSATNPRRSWFARKLFGTRKIA